MQYLTLSPSHIPDKLDTTIVIAKPTVKKLVTIRVTIAAVCKHLIQFPLISEKARSDCHLREDEKNDRFFDLNDSLKFSMSYVGDVELERRIDRIREMIKDKKLNDFEKQYLYDDLECYEVLKISILSKELLTYLFRGWYFSTFFLSPPTVSGG